MALRMLLCLALPLAYGATAQHEAVQDASFSTITGRRLANSNIATADESCDGKCKQPHKACNLEPNGKPKCLPCNKAGRTCCADSTCLKGLSCGANNKCSEELSPPDAAYIVTQCQPGSMTVESTTADADLPVAGNVFYNLAAAPSSPEDVCMDCGQFGAVVTGVGAPGACASGADPCVAVQLETRPARLNEMYEPGLLAAASLTDVADKTALEILGCAEDGAEATRSARRRLAGMTAGAGRSLLQAAPPSTCTAAAWNAVAGDGRCVYTDCYVGDERPADCFGCSGGDCNNGCGPEPASILDWLQNVVIPESIGEIYDFSEVCCNHDYCYASTAFDQATCDTRLLNEALATCADPDESSIDIIRWIRKPITLVRQELCERAAQLYYFAVDRAGAGPKAAGEAATEAYEQSEECAAPCPTTQRSGGKGGTLLRIDMNGRTGPFDVSYEMYTIKDALEITYGPSGSGDVLFTTGGLVSGSQSTQATMPADGGSNIVTVSVDAPEDGTAWDIFVGCPANAP